MNEAMEAKNLLAQRNKFLEETYDKDQNKINELN